MTNSEKLRNMAIDDLLKSIKSRAENTGICVMELLPNGRAVCPWHNDCDKCLQEWLNEEDTERPAQKQTAPGGTV